jgi:hypothetical protein
VGLEFQVTVSGHRPITLRHDNDPQRLNAPAALSQVGSITGQHRHDRFLILQILDHDIRPTSAQNIEHLASIYTRVRHQDRRRGVTSYKPSEAHVAPLPLATRHPIPDIAQCTAEPTRGITQA